MCGQRTNFRSQFAPSVMEFQAWNSRPQAEQQLFSSMEPSHKLVPPGLKCLGPHKWSLTYLVTGVGPLLVSDPWLHGLAT